MPPLPAGSDLNIPGLSSFITPNGSFYRVDTALLVPQVDPATWQRPIHGMVQREVTITFAELLKRPLIEDYVTDAHRRVLDPVSGPYVGNAKWLGASLAALIRQARPLAGADQLLVHLGRRVHLRHPAAGGTGRPGRPARRRDERHGAARRARFPGLDGGTRPVRLRVRHQVGDRHRGDHLRDSHCLLGPARLVAAGADQDRIQALMCPIGGATITPGRTPVAGVAWAQHKGIAAVEVRVDRGPWHQARLAAVPDIDTWRQWVWDWQATPGNHLIEARATDQTGYTQTPVQAQPPPNGASGYPSAAVTVGSS